MTSPPVFPPVFEPYVLSPLDHLTAPVHLSTFFTFRPEHPHEAVDTLETGILQLISLLPFLAGNIALSSQLEGKENVREVQPTTAELLREHPLLKVRHHDMSISPSKLKSSVSRDAMLNEEFIPIPFAMAMGDLIPVFRVQANVMRDGVIICASFYHLALDGFGFCNALKALADCCRSSGSVSLATDPCKETQTRRKILEAGLDSNVERNLHSNFGEYVGDELPSMRPESPISRIFTLDAARVESLRNACNALLRRRSNTEDVYLSSNSIISSVFWLCFIRCRHRFLSTTGNSYKDTIPDQSCLMIGVDVRNVLQLPLSYMGNAALGVQTFTDPDAILAFLAQSRETSAATEDVNLNEVEILTNLSRQMHEIVQQVTRTYVQGEISRFCASNNWATYVQPGDISVSSLRNMSFYELDFGSSLGRLENFDFPENRISGVGWVMPARFKGAPWEVRIALEPRIMEEMQKDRLMKWLFARKMPKL